MALFLGACFYLAGRGALSARLAAFLACWQCLFRSFAHYLFEIYWRYSWRPGACCREDDGTCVMQPLLAIAQELGGDEY